MLGSCGAILCRQFGAFPGWTAADGVWRPADAGGVLRLRRGQPALGVLEWRVISPGRDFASGTTSGVSAGTGAVFGRVLFNRRNRQDRRRNADAGKQCRLEMDAREW